MSRHLPSPAPIALAVALILAHAPSSHAQTPGAAASRAAVSFHIEAKPLGQALNDWAMQARVQLIVQPALVKDKSAPAVSGSMTPQQALQSLLKDSGLVGLQEGSAFVIQAVPVGQVDGDQALPVVQVSASAAMGSAQARERGYRVKRSTASGFREQAVLDTPFSVSVVSAEVMQDQQAKSLLDVTKNDASVSAASNPLFFDRVNVRGFNLSVDAIYRDGLSINDQGAISLENKAAIEIVKGLSALRYGFTSPGGVVNYVLKRPTAQPLSRVTVSANEHGGMGVHGDWSRRFGEQEQVGVRINMASEKLRNHIDAYHGNKRFFSSIVEWQVTSSLLLEAELEHQKREALSVSNARTSWWSSLASARAAFPSLTPETHAWQSWAREPNEQTYYTARAQYRLTDGWTAKLALQRAELKRDQRSVSASSTQPNGNYSTYLYYAPDQERNNTAWQAVVEGDFKTGGLTHEVAFGHDAVKRDQTWPDAFYAVIGTGNLYSDAQIADPHAVTGASALRSRTRQSAFFLTDTIGLTDWMKVFGGLRRTDLETFSGNAAGKLTKTYDRGTTTPTVGVVFKPLADLSIYASHAEGIQQGGQAPVDTNNRNEIMGPLKSSQEEVGLKYELPGGALLTAAVFQIDKGLEYTNASNFYVQDGSQVHKGIEASVNGMLTPKLRVIAGAAYLRAKVEKTSNLSILGKRPQGVPDWQANLFVDGNLSSLLPGLFANGGVYYSGAKAIDTANTWMAESYARIDLGLRYVQAWSDERSVTYRLNIDNVTDKRYLTNTSGGALEFGLPRTVKVSATVDF